MALVTYQGFGRGVQELRRVGGKRGRLNLLNFATERFSSIVVDKEFLCG